MIGLRMGQYGWHASRWLNADFIFTHNLTPWQFDAGERMQLNHKVHGKEIENYNLRWLLNCWMDPRIRASDHPPSFLDAVRMDPELLPHTELGPVPFEKNERFPPVNVQHRSVRDYAVKFYEDLGRLYAKDPRVVLFEYEAEPSSWTQIEGKTYPFGYSKVEKEQFHVFLQGKFKTVAALNTAWSSIFDSFDAIQPPTYQVIQEKLPENLPRIYEFQKFRKQNNTAHFKRIYDAYRRGGPTGAPVANRYARGYCNGNFADAYDTYRIAADTMDIFSTHDCAEGSARHRAELNYSHSIAEYANKPRGSLEFYPFNPEGNSFDPDKHDSMVLFYRGINSLWRLLAWDVTTICPWIENSTGGRQGVGLWSPTRESAMTLIHQSAGVVPLVEKQVEEGLGNVLLNTRIVKPSIAMLAPFDASIVGWPDGQVQNEGTAIHRFLDEKNYDYFCVPEELIVSGRESLTGVKVMFAPYVLWASETVQKKLLDWVARGGVLVSLGPFGFWDEYGRPSRVLINKTLGNMPIEVKRAEVYSVSFPLPPTLPASGSGQGEGRAVSIETVMPYTDRKQPNLIRADLGLGKVYFTADTQMDEVLAESKAVILRAVDEAIGVRNAWCVNQYFELVTRQMIGGATGSQRPADRYLILLNRSIERTCEDTIVVKGEYRDIVDLSVAGGFPIKAKASAGVTVFRTRLGAGEGTCIRLGAYHPAVAPKAKRDAFIQAETSGNEKRIEEALGNISTQGDSVSFAKAVTCKNVALVLQSQGKPTEALEFAQRARQFTQSKPSTAMERASFQSWWADTPVTVDGEGNEWGLVAWTPMGTARFKSLWDENFLYFLIEVKDGEISNNSRPPDLYNGDCVEIFIDVLGQGGDRKHGRLDFHFVVSPDGRVQVVDKERLTRTRAAGTRIPDGYSVEVALSNNDTFLAPVAGCELALNLRQLDFGIKDSAFRYLGGPILKETGYHPGFNTHGWPRLRLEETNLEAAPAKAEYTGARNVIEVYGQGNTLQSIAKQIGNESIIRVSGNQVTLSSNLHLSTGAELILGSFILRNAVSMETSTFSAEKGSRLRLAGDPVFVDIDAIAALKTCRLSSATRNRAVIRKQIVVCLTDKRGRPLRDATIGVKVTASVTAEVISDSSQRPDEKGTIRLDLPAAVFEVELEKATVHEKRYDLVINDTAVTAVYPLEDVRPLAQTEYNLTCNINR